MSDYDQDRARRSYLNISDEMVNLTDEVLSIEDKNARIRAKVLIEEADESLFRLKLLLSL